MPARGRQRRRTSTVSTADFLELAYRLDKWGDIFIKMGEIEQLEREAGDFARLMRKLLRLGPLEFFAVVQNNPDLLVRLRAFYATFENFAEETSDKTFMDLSADEQIELGRSCKDFSRLVTAVADGMG